MKLNHIKLDIQTHCPVTHQQTIFSQHHLVTCSTQNQRPLSHKLYRANLQPSWSTPAKHNDDLLNRACYITLNDDPLNGIMFRKHCEHKPEWDAEMG